MIADPATVVLTAHVAHWADDDPARTAWILDCLHRHNTSDWGDLDQHDAAANDHALAEHDGRLLSSYPMPHELTDPADGDDRSGSSPTTSPTRSPRSSGPATTDREFRFADSSGPPDGWAARSRSGARSRLDDALQLVQRLAYVTERRRQIGQHGSHRLALRPPSRHTTRSAPPRATDSTAPSRSTAATPRSRASTTSRRSSRIEHMFATPSTLTRPASRKRQGLSQTITRWVHPTPPYTGVLSIAKLRVGQEAYHLSGVAQSLDDYYTGAGEAHGQWVGGGASRLGLDGQVDPDDLRAVLAGLRPGTGGLTPNGDTMRPHPRRVPGFDLTFKAPKSASVLYAVSDDPRVQGAVIEAGEAAMRVRSAGWSVKRYGCRRGSHNLAYLARLDDHDRAGRRPPTPGDQRGGRGVVPASHLPRRRPAAALARARRQPRRGHRRQVVVVRSPGDLPARPCRRRGVPGRLPRRADPPARRRVASRAYTSPRSPASPNTSSTRSRSAPTRSTRGWQRPARRTRSEGRQAAVLATRRNKPEREPECFDAVWKLEAESLGWGPAQAEGLVVAVHAAQPGRDRDVWRLETVGFDEHGNADVWERTVTPDEWITDLLRRDLTADRTTFTHPDLTTAIAKRLGDGATVDTIERLTRPSSPPRTPSPSNKPTCGRRHGPAARCSTSSNASSAPSDIAATSSCQTASVGGLLDTRTDLGDDQRTAVQQICTSTAAVAVLVGPAGTGKTYTIDTIRTIFETAGITVIGAAPSARAAHELAAATGMPTTTLHRHLLHTDTAPRRVVRDRRSRHGRHPHPHPHHHHPPRPRRPRAPRR